MPRKPFKLGIFEPVRISQKHDTVRQVWEALGRNNERTISDWAISSRSRGKLRAKIDTLRRAEVSVSGKIDLPFGTCDGPSMWGQKWIYKLKVNGEEALRPMFCMGPIVMATEWTFLSRAKEKDRDTTEQKTAAAEATLTRAGILRDPTKRALYPSKHHETY